MDEAQIASISQRAEDLDIPVHFSRHTISDTMLLLNPLKEAELRSCPALQVCVHACPLLSGCFAWHVAKCIQPQQALSLHDKMSPWYECFWSVTHSMRQDLLRRLHKKVVELDSDACHV